MGKTKTDEYEYSKNALDADKKAFLKLLQHIKETDAKQQTIVMIQVENETGQLPEARGHSPAANNSKIQYRKNLLPI